PPRVEHLARGQIAIVIQFVEQRRKTGKRVVQHVLAAFPHRAGRHHMLVDQAVGKTRLAAIEKAHRSIGIPAAVPDLLASQERSAGYRIGVAWRVLREQPLDLVGKFRAYPLVAIHAEDPELADEIKRLLAQDAPCDAYSIPRRTFL